MKKFFVPEVVQTSNLDCGPASLKALLEGFGKSISYGRLREACQTGIDGTSIDSLESVANQLGLEAEQVMLPADHLLLRHAKSLPAIVVTRRPNGLTHFVVLWRQHGNLIQVMDPAIGRRWISAGQLQTEIYHHTVTVAAADWFEFSKSEQFCNALTERLANAGIAKRDANRLIESARSQATWLPLATLDAGTRLLMSLIAAQGVGRGEERLRLLQRLSESSELIPDRYWSARPAPSVDGQEHVYMRGAVLVRTSGKTRAVPVEELSLELAAAVQEIPVHPGRRFVKILWESGSLSSTVLLIALVIAAAGVVAEAVLFRGLLDVASELQLAGQRIGAMAAVLLFSFGLLLLEAPLFNGFLRLGRQVETRFRIAFLDKIPKLGDQYFQSRLTSDMAERSHSTNRLRNLPNHVSRFLRTCFELCFTAPAIAWLDPPSAWLAGAAAVAAIFPALASQSLQRERDLRVHTHAAGLTRFYLDAMLGLVAIRAHGAERSVRREHEKLLGEWGQASLRLQKAVVWVEAFQLLTTFALVVGIVLGTAHSSHEIGRVLLLVYWALNIPVQGQQIASIARQYPYYRNLLFRLIDPLGAPEEDPSTATAANAVDDKALAIKFLGVGVQAAGHTVLKNIDLDIPAGSHVAVVGRSGAGKSSLVSVLLGWLKPCAGEVHINGRSLDAEWLRERTAWLDPSIQLWNDSLYSNLVYGSEADPAAVANAVQAAALRQMLELLPQGLQAVLGEGGGFVSGGEGQRVRLGRALLRANTRLVILDEPFRGLDRERRRELLARAREHWRNATLICITHDIEETQAFDQVVVVEDGQIAESGTPMQLMRDRQSRYLQLLQAEHEVRTGMWEGDFWRRLHVHAGRVVEETPSGARAPRENTAKRHETAVA